MEYGVLSGKKIIEEVDAGRISISPFVRKNVNPASVDLTLGKKVSVYRDTVYGGFTKDHENGISGEFLQPTTHHPASYYNNNHLDAKKQNQTLDFTLENGEGIFLKPGIGYLMHTAESVWTESFVPILDGKSSIGRLFAMVHVTAGYGDPGFKGQYTLEVLVTHPVILYVGMKICQMRFHTISGEHTSYQETGSYKGNLAEGPIPSQSYRMFQK